MRNAARVRVWATCVCVLVHAHVALAAGSTLPSPWVNQDIGIVGLPGSVSATGGVFTVKGAGADIWGSADAFQSVMQPETGDVQIVARVASIQNTNAHAKAGVMLRGTLTAGSADVILDVQPGGSVEFMTRAVNGGAVSWVSGATQTTPTWLKLTRTGTTVTAFVSSNGTAWSQVGTTSLTLPASAFVGFVVSSHDVTQLNTSTFDNVAVTGGSLNPLPSPWTNQDVGAVGLAGSATYANGVFTVKGAGADVWGPADGFQAVSQPLSGDVQLIARVTAIQNTGSYAKAGLMLRDSLSAGAAHVVLDVEPNGSIEFMTRSTTGGATRWLSGATQAAPVWLKLTRAGTTVTGYTSTNGTTWTQAGTTTLTFGANPLAALIVSSHDTTQLNTTTFDNVTAGPLPIVIPPPSAPSSPVPSSSATGISSAVTLTWAASGATSYDVRFGASNPPGQVASAITTASYAVSNLQQGATFYWQVVAKNGGGTTAGPVWSFTTQPPPPPPPTAPSSPSPSAGLTGVGSPVALAWASSGATSYDVYFGPTNPPAQAAANLAAPAYALSNLQPGTAYYWQVVAKNSSGNTSGPVWSFAMQVAAPSAPSLPAPSSGGTNVPASPQLLTWNASGATSYDVFFGATNPPSQAASSILTPSYTASGLQQAASYYWKVVARNAGGATAGPVWSFTTQSPPPPPVTGAPNQYVAITDRLTRAKPALPQVGPAGFQFSDPTFGSPMLRVTDGSTRPGLANRSYRMPSNAHLAAWNAASTKFYVISNDGTVIPYTFDAQTMTAARIQASPSGNGGLTLAFYVEPHFSLVDPDLIYGVGGSNNRTVMAYQFSTGTYTTVVNLDTIVPGVTGYVGGFMTGGVPSETLLTYFGGGSQDHHYYALVKPLGGGPSKLLDTVASTINGTPTSTTLNFHIHGMQIDKSGRYVFIYPTGTDLAAPRNAAQVYLWDTATDVITSLAGMLTGGHDAAGFGVWVNQDCCTSSTWEAAQWQFRALATPSQTNDLISPVPLVKEVYLADHTTWNNAQPDRLVPVISSTYRYGNNTTAWRAWDDEIIGIDTTNGIGGTVWRFAHHRSAIGSDADPTVPYFWYEPIANISPDGKWVLFTSNWEKTLGADAAEGTARQDVFLVQLTPVQ